ncbi:hypothetical protein H6758_02300 [Candidatus Nomurabacteria bacterium]|nr:hypothetical protein [Candidatus Nomurabacteria bacterium]
MYKDKKLPPKCSLTTTHARFQTRPTKEMSGQLTTLVGFVAMPPYGGLGISCEWSIPQVVDLFQVFVTVRTTLDLQEYENF